MNPFDEYTGINLNGRFFDKTSIKEIAPTKLEQEVLSFTEELFSPKTEISVSTSGSTGKPKEIYFPKSAFVQSALATNKYFNLDKKSSTFLALPLSYIAAKMMICRALVGGYNLQIANPSTQPLYKGLDFDFAPFTSHQLAIILENQSELIPKGCKILIGGGAVSKALVNHLRKIDADFFVSFGMTETLSHFAIANLKNDGSSFIVMNDSKIKLGMDGRLSVKREGITMGWIETNDRCKVTEQGFQWLGRMDNVINSGGVKIQPEQLEQELSDLIKYPYFVYGIPDSILGERLVLFVEGNEIPNIDTIEFKRKYEKPKDIIALEVFSYTESGKIKRNLTVKNWLKNRLE